MKNITNKKILIFIGLTITFSVSPFEARAAIVNVPSNFLGMIGYWTFDGKDMTPNVRDISGQGNHGNLSHGGSGTTTVSGKVGQALQFDGSNDYFEASSMPETYGNFTVSAWYKSSQTTSTDDQYIFVHSQTGQDQLSFGTTDDASHTDQLRFNLFVNGDSDRVYYGTSDIVDRQWHHVVGVRTSTHLLLYVDGVLELNTADLDAGETIDFSGEAGPYIGDSPGNTEQVNGTLDDLRFYNRALSIEEVRGLYNGSVGKFNTTKSPGTLATGLVGHWTFDGADMIPNVRDISGQGKHGLLQGQISTSTAAGKVGQALVLDSSDDYVLVGDHSSFITPQGTVCTWVKPAADLGYAPVSWGDGTANWWTIYIGNGVTNSLTNELITIPYDSGLGSNRVGYVTANRAELYDSNWHHVCVTADGSAYGIYLDGNSKTVSVGTGANNGQYNDIGGTKLLTFGVEYPNFGRYNGAMDEVRIYNRALSANEIKQIYNLGTQTVNASQTNSRGTLNQGLVGYWSFDGRDVTTAVKDRSGNGNDGYILNTATSTATVPGKIGQAVQFDGIDDSIYVLDNSAYEPTDAITISAWFNPSSTSNTNYPMVLGKAQTGGFQLHTDHVGDDCDLGPDRLCWALRVAGAYRFVGSVTTIAAGNWYHFVATYDGAAMRLYINGVLEGTTPQTGTIGWNAVSLRFGGDSTNADGLESPFAGKIDDVRIYNRALSANEAKQLYNLAR